MRISLLGVAACCLLAAPAAAQAPRDVTGPWTLSPSIVTCIDIPVLSRPVPRIVVRSSHSPESRIAMADGEIVIARTPGDGLAVGQRYLSARLHGNQMPRTGEGYGDVRLSGIVRVTAVDDLNAIATIEKVCDGIEPGDFLEPFTALTLPTAAAAMEPPDFSERARVLFGADNRLAYGFGDTLSIDRGTVNGLVPGARFALYRDKRNGDPLVYIGEAVVMVTGEQTSKVVVTKSTDALQQGDVAVPRRKP